MEKQKVAIARVLVSDKPILIFDDALSVDNKTDMIRGALSKKNINQQISLLHTVSLQPKKKIIVINNGQIKTRHKESKMVFIINKYSR